MQQKISKRLAVLLLNNSCWQFKTHLQFIEIPKANQQWFLFYMIFIKAGEFLFEYIGAIHTGSAQGSAEPEPSLQCEQGSAWIVSAGLEFLIRAAGYSHLWLSLVSAWNPEPSSKSSLWNTPLYLFHKAVDLWMYDVKMIWDNFHSNVPIE